MMTRSVALTERDVARAVADGELLLELVLAELFDLGVAPAFGPASTFQARRKAQAVAADVAALNRHG